MYDDKITSLCYMGSCDFRIDPYLLLKKYIIKLKVNRKIDKSCIRVSFLRLISEETQESRFKIRIQYNWQ